MAWLCAFHEWKAIRRDKGVDAIDTLAYAHASHATRFGPQSQALNGVSGLSPAQEKQLEPVRTSRLPFVPEAWGSCCSFFGLRVGEGAALWMGFPGRRALRRMPAGSADGWFGLVRQRWRGGGRRGICGGLMTGVG